VPQFGVPLAYGSIRVLVNSISAHTGGGRTYAIEQVAALSRIPGVHVTVVVPAATAADLGARCAEGTTVLAQPRRGLVRRIAFEQLLLPVAARGHDVVYLTGNFAMFASPRPQVVTLHNAHHFGRSERACWRRRYPLRARVRLEFERAGARLTVRRAEALVVVSHAFRKAVEEDTDHRTNIHVIPSARPRIPARSEGSESYITPPGPYILAIATDYPHKDWDGLIRTFLDDKQLPRLVVVGECRSKARMQKLRRTIAAVSDRPRVVLLGRVTDREHIASLYDGAAAYIAHSFLETFGLTPLEARAYGLPVVASDIPAHRETCGVHATYYDPADSSQLAGAVSAAVAHGRSLPHRDGSSAWNWDANARALAELLRSVARHPA
jgi:glycosyltransferase involved in cell wall biosynthesis